MFLFKKQGCVLLWVTNQERARAFAATIQWITFRYSFCHKVQFLWCTFQTHFGMGTSLFRKLVLRMKLFLSLKSFICCKLIQGCENIFHLCRYQNQNFSLASHPRRLWNTLVTFASLLSQSCCPCLGFVLRNRLDHLLFAHKGGQKLLYKKSNLPQK